MPDRLLTVGWREWVALPELGLPAVKAKVDTGARTSSLHAVDVVPFERDGVPFVRFAVVPVSRRPEAVRVCEAPLVDRRVVSDSGGHRERRYVIVTPLALGGRRWPTEITLTNRATMRFRMLVGRTAMAGHLVVDPSGSYLTGRSPLGAAQAPPPSSPPTV